jgi:fructose-bisphosphate aldolase class II
MTLVPLGAILHEALKQEFAVGLFVAADNSFIKPIIEAAAEQNSPVIVGGHFDYFQSPIDVRVFARTVTTYAEDVNVPVVLHLDHGTNLRDIMFCIREGFTSIMFDGAKHPLKTNIQLTKQLVKIVRSIDVSIEAEIDEIPLDTDLTQLPVPDDMMTNPELAARFVEETEVDSLAIAVGQIHRAPTREGSLHKILPIGHLNFERIQAIRSATDVALCLHGSTHTPEDQVQKAVQLGVSKVNIGTALLIAHVNSIHHTFMLNPNVFEADQIVVPSQNSIKKIVKHKIEVLGSANTW